LVRQAVKTAAAESEGRFGALSKDLEDVKEELANAKARAHVER
jgi:hypothetical protein